MYVSKEESTKIRVNIYGQGHQHSARSVIGKKPMICSSYLDMHDLWPSIISLNLKKETRMMHELNPKPSATSMSTATSTAKIAKISSSSSYI